MSSHLIDGEFQSDKYPTTPRGKVPLSVKDVTAQDLLWEYAQRRRVVDAEFSGDLETALKAAGYAPREKIAWDDWSDDERQWNPETGAPGIAQFRSAIQLWSIFQNRPTSVAQAAEAFNCEPTRIVEAIDAGSQWSFIYLDGPRDDYAALMIEHEGE